MDKPAILGLIGSILILIMSIPVALIAPFLFMQDVTPINPADQAAGNFGLYVLFFGGFIIAGLGLLGSLLRKDYMNISFRFLKCATILWVVFSIYIYLNLLIFRMIFLLIALIPAILLIIAWIIAYKVHNQEIDNDSL